MSNPLLIRDTVTCSGRLCKCTSFCTTHNPETQTYEGDGHWLPDQTFHDHRDFEKFKRNEEENSHHPPPLFVFTNLATKIQTISDELDWLGSLPIVCPSKSLVFQQEKAGVAVVTLDEYANANHVFFKVQSCLRYLFTTAQSMPLCDDRDEVAGRIQDALQDLDTLKCCQWHIQSGMIEVMHWNNPRCTNTRAAVINTGECNVYNFHLYIFMFNHRTRCVP